MKFYKGGLHPIALMLGLHSRKEPPVEESAAFHYGLCAFEGILCWKDSSTKKPHLFRLESHLERLGRSIAYLGLSVPIDTLRRAVMEKVCGISHSAYVRPIIHARSHFSDISLRKGKPVVEVFTVRISNSAYLRRMLQPHRAVVLESPMVCWGEGLSQVKISGKYLCFLSAQQKAKQRGCDDALLLDPRGKVVEAATANLVLVKGKDLLLPKSDQRFPGITQDTVVSIARDLGIGVLEEDIVTADLGTFEDAFIVGTAAGMVPISSISAGKSTYRFSMGETQRSLRKAYVNAFRGKAGNYGGWLTPVGDAR